jgi:hypothetical protein
VLDLGRLTVFSLAILEETKDLFIVTTPELPALFETSRLLQRLLDAGFPREKLRLLLNRKTKGDFVHFERFRKGPWLPCLRVHCRQFARDGRGLRRLAGFWTRTAHAQEPSLR